MHQTNNVFSHLLLSTPKKAINLVSTLSHLKQVDHLLEQVARFKATNT